MESAALVVHVFWDSEAGVFVATSDDVPGLVIEAPTWEALQVKLDTLIPELFELNGGVSSGLREVELITEERRMVRLHACCPAIRAT